MHNRTNNNTIVLVVSERFSGTILLSKKLYHTAPLIICSSTGVQPAYSLGSVCLRLFYLSRELELPPPSSSPQGVSLGFLLQTIFKEGRCTSPPLSDAIPSHAALARRETFFHSPTLACAANRTYTNKNYLVPTVGGTENKKKKKKKGKPSIGTTRL